MGDVWPSGNDWLRAGQALGLGARALGKMVIGMDASGELVRMELLADEGLELLGYPNQDPIPGKSTISDIET